MASLTRAPSVPFVVFFGNEDFFLDKEIERARSWPKREVVLLEGEDLTEVELISLLETVSMDEPRTLILDNAQKMKVTKTFRAFVDKLSPRQALTILVAVVRSEKLPETWSYVSQQKGKCVPPQVFLKFKPWDTKGITHWVNEELAKYGKTMSPEAVAALIAAVSMDLYRLSNEIRKLALLVGSEPVIPNDQLSLVVSRSRTATQFDVSEASIAKSAKQAMNAFSILYKNEGDQAFVPMVGALMKQVERTLVARNLIDRGVAADDIAATVGLKPFLAMKLLENARKHSSKDLARYMGQLCKLDVHVKGSARSKRTLVELAILSIAR